MNIKYFAPMIIAASVLVTPAHAQDSTSKDIDDLVVCNLIYGRTAQLYQEKGEIDKAAEFTNVMNAYGVVASVYAQATYGSGIGVSYVEKRMPVLVEALNKQSEGKKQGDVEVISEWLTYCDALGPEVSAFMAQPNFVY